MGKIMALASKTGKAVKNSKIFKGVVTVTPTYISVSAFSDTAVAVTGIADPVKATKVAIKLILKNCLPPQLYVACECSTFAIYLVNFVISGGSWQGVPVLVWLANFVVTKIGEN